MAFTSLTFIAFITAVVLLTHAMPAARARALVLLGANAVFIGSYVTSPVQVLPLLGFLALGFFAIEAVRRTRSVKVLWLALGLFLAAFIVLKKFSFLDAAWLLPFPYLLVGLSYILFRVLHLMVDAQQGELERPVSPLGFLNYACNFLTFTAGPIQRYPEHAEAAARPLSLDADQVFQAFARIIKGFVKVGVVSAIANWLFDSMSGRLLDASVASPYFAYIALYIGTATVYTVYLYANFAGYMDIVIGLGKLLGMDLPENFNRPFRARSFLDFWSRWHMTLSDWFKTYLFNPLLRVLAGRVTSPAAAPYLGVIAFFITFLVMGVWHGTTLVFVVYGLLMGAGASLNKLWQVHMTRRLGKKGYKALAERPLYATLARGMTFTYFALALTCLWVEMPQLQLLAGRLGMAGLLLSFIVLSVLAGVLLQAWDALVSLSSGVRGLALRTSHGVVARNLVLAAQILLIATVASFFHKAPEFVYRAF